MYFLWIKRMGNYTDFYQTRGPNLLTRLKVTYDSGRIEYHDYKTQLQAYQMQEEFLGLSTCKRATVLKRRIKPKLEAA